MFLFFSSFIIWFNYLSKLYAPTNDDCHLLYKQSNRLCIFSYPLCFFEV